MATRYEPGLSSTDTEKLLLLGGLCTESILNALRSSGISYTNKLFSSSPANWDAIEKLLRDEGGTKISGVLAQLSEKSLVLCCLPEYRQHARNILSTICLKPHMLLIYGENLRGNFTALSSEAAFRSLCLRLEKIGIRLPSRKCLEESLNELILFLKISGLKLAPYRFTPDLTAMALSFLEELERGLVVRFYIPSERLLSREVDKIIELMQDYLLNIAGQNVSLEKKRTGKGVVYSLFSKAGYSSERLEEDLQNLSSLMLICAKDPNYAAELLANASLPKERILPLITRYARETRRLLIDIDYERKSKLLMIEHQLRSELADVEQSDADIRLIARAAASDAESSAASFVAPLANATGLRGLRENMNPETWKRARLIAIREFDRDLSNEEILMLDTITAASSDGERNLLMSALHELRDKELSQAEKTSAWSRLQTFVAKASPTLGRSLLSVLEKYLAYKLTTP